MNDADTLVLSLSGILKFHFLPVDNDFPFVFCIYTGKNFETAVRDEIDFLDEFLARRSSRLKK